METVEVTIKKPDSQLAAQDQAANAVLLKAQVFAIDVTLPIEPLNALIREGGDFAKDCRRSVKDREAMRLNWTRPIRDSIDNINKSFKPGTEMLDKAARLYAGETLKGQQEVQKRIAEENARIAKANAEAERLEREANKLQQQNATPGDVPPPVIITRQAPIMAPKPKNQRKTWTHKIVTPRVLHGDYVIQYLKDNDKYDDTLRMALNEVIRKAVEKKDGSIDKLKISGVEIKQVVGFVGR